MGKFANFDQREVERRLAKLGMVYVRAAKGSHKRWKNPSNGRRTTVPKRILPGTLKAILSQLDISDDEFLNAK